MCEARVPVLGILAFRICGFRILPSESLALKSVCGEFECRVLPVFEIPALTIYNKRGRYTQVPTPTHQKTAKFAYLTGAKHINFGHSHFPQKIPPNRQEWGPQLPGPRVSVEILRKH